jgi:polyisoprenoid-binding protein YceI
MLTRTVLLLLATCAAQSLAADAYHLDPAKTRVEFDVERFGMLWVTAFFPVFSGDFVFDRTGSASRVDVEVQVASVDCHDPRWNLRLRSREWLDAQTYPKMTYHSSQVQFDAAHRATARGLLSLHGITRPVVLHVSELECDAGRPSASCRFVARASISRSEYGLPHGFWTGGDQVDILLSGVGTRAASGDLARQDGS